MSDILIDILNKDINGIVIDYLNMNKYQKIYSNVLKEYSKIYNYNHYRQKLCYVFYKEQIYNWIEINPDKSNPSRRIIGKFN